MKSSTTFPGRWHTRLLVVVVLLACLYYLYVHLDSKHEELKAGDKLPFVPKKGSYDCDDLFQNSDADSFNFTEQYYLDLPIFSGEIQRLTKGAFSGDGHTAMFPTQHKVLQFLATRSFVTSICETGFNYGHSSFTFATAKKNNKILSFDIGHHGYTLPMMTFLNKTYPGKFTTVLGDSSVTLPKFVNDNPTYKCNMFFVDGSHTYEIGYSDIKNFRKMSEPINIIVFDDFPTKNNQFDNKLGKAWEQAKSEKMLVELMRCTRKKDVIRGFTVGKFI